MGLILENVSRTTLRDVTPASERLMRNELDNGRIVAVNFRVDDGPLSHRIAIMVNLDAVPEEDVVKIAKEKCLEIATQLSTPA